MSRSELFIYRDIVDLLAHAMSEAFDLPHDMDELDASGWDEFLVRPVTDFEVQAYGIEDPDSAFAGIGCPSGLSRQMTRIIFRSPEDWLE